MTPRRLAAVGVLAVLAIGGAFWLAGQRSLERDVSSEPLYPGLKEDIDQLEGLRVYGPGDTVVVTVTRVDDRWQVLERGGYPADASRLRNLFRDLAAANRIEQKTAQPQRYAELGVEGIEGSDAGGVRIVLEGVDPDVDLIVGKQASGRGGSYVRRSGDAASWLIDRTLAVPRSPAEWLDRAVIDIGADRIQSAEIAADGSEYEAAKASRADADFAVTGVPEARQLSSPGAANGLATSLQRLEADDVRPMAELGDDTPDATARYRTFDGLVLTLRGYEVEDARYLSIEAAADPGLAARFALADPSHEGPTENDGNVSADAMTPATGAEAERINAQTRGWIYAVPGYKYDAIFRPLDELLAPRAE